MFLNLIIFSVFGGAQCKNVLLIVADDAGLEVSGECLSLIDINDLATDWCTGKSAGENSTSGQPGREERSVQQSIHLGQQLLPQQVRHTDGTPSPSERDVRPPPRRPPLRQL